MARELANQRADVVHPEYLASFAENLATTHHLPYRVVLDKDLRAEDLNLLASVGQAGHFPARLVAIEYRGAPESKDVIALVGKGITFDSGGLNLKPTGKMEEMHLDMCMKLFVVCCLLFVRRQEREGKGGGMRSSWMD